MVQDFYLFSFLRGIIPPITQPTNIQPITKKFKPPWELGLKWIQIIWLHQAIGFCYQSLLSHPDLQTRNNTFNIKKAKYAKSATSTQ